MLLYSMKVYFHVGDCILDIVAQKRVILIILNSNYITHDYYRITTWSSVYGIKTKFASRKFTTILSKIGKSL